MKVNDMQSPHPPTDPSSVLIAHDRWANQHLYQACKALTQEQLNKPFDMGTGSIHNNLVHNLSAMQAWTDVLNELPRRPDIEDNAYTIDQIIELHAPTTADFEQAAISKPFDTVISRERGGQTYTFTAGGILTHVMTHSMHHRAQCLNMLRHLGVQSQPMSSVAEWMRATNG